MVMDNKRKADESALVAVPKRSRNEVANINTKTKQLQTLQSVPRTSNLFAPIMALEGHEGDIFTVDFHPNGQYLASSGFDRRIFLWSVYGECENISVLTGHTGAILQLAFSPDGAHLYTASTDHTLGLWDVAAGVRVKKFRGHGGFVNSVCGGGGGGILGAGVSAAHHSLVSGGDDCSVRVWDVRKRNSAMTITTKFQVTAVSFAATASASAAATSHLVYSAGIDNDITTWDVRHPLSPVSRMRGHTDTVTALSLSPDGSYLLSNGMDGTVRIWDTRPYAPVERCVKIFTGHQHNFEKNLLGCAWSPDGTRISAGSADRFVYIWDTTSRRILYKLPGHNGSVNDVKFHPTEPVIVSGASDKVLYLGEIAATGNLIEPV